MQTNAILLYYNALTFVFYIPLLVALIVFYRFTGLAFSDVATLSGENLVQDNLGDWWIRKVFKCQCEYKGRNHERQARPAHWQE